ncbi:MAG: right-handed parallel beta-helix repeat-containing protein [Rubrivivax sp.]|nr:right-handed parallel beta-helix repeat-containing protein [Rubrivivax sp.]
MPRHLFLRPWPLPWLVAAWLALCPWQAIAADLIAGPDGQPMSLQQALTAARDGDVIGLLPGEYRGQVALIQHKQLTLRGLGKRPVFVADGKIAEGKAILVIRDGDITIENIEFRGARASDANGAGIRFEKGRLTVRRSAFFDNENGILTANDGAAEMTIEDSEFGQAPQVVGGLHHLLYVGRIARVTITGSRFHQGFEGHLIKSRARETRIAYNLIHDGPNGRASYQVDIPNGGIATLIGNVIGQGGMAENPVVVAYGAEGRAWDRNVLALSHNTFINRRWLPAWFLRVWRDRLPEATEVRAVNNLSVGPGIFTLGVAGEFSGNFPALGSSLIGADTLAFELARDSIWVGRGADPRHIGGQDLSPRAEFAFPIGTRALAPLTRWSPGAFQR